MIMRVFQLKKILVLSIIVIIPLTTSNEIRIVEDEEVSSTRSLISCTTGIIKNYTTEHDIISILIPDDGSSLGYFLLNAVYKNSDWSVQVLRNRGSSYNSSSFLKSQVYIIPVSSETDIETEILLLKVQKRTWSPHARFIMISATILPNKNLFISETIEKLSKQKVYKMIFLLSQDNNTEAFNIHTWFPYANGNCANQYHDTTILDVCYHGTFFKNSNIFPELIPLDLHQCPVRVGTVLSAPYVIGPKPQAELENVSLNAGTDILMMNNIAEKFNFSVRYLVNNGRYKWGVLGYLGKPTGLFRLLSGDLIDIVLGSMTQTPERYIYVDPSTIYGFESCSWYVPTASLKPKWESILQAFNFIIWMLILLCIILTTFVLFITNSIGKNTISFFESFLYVFSMFLNISVWSQPRIFLLRYLFILWAIFSLIITTSYQAELFKFLINPMKEKQISNTYELGSSSLPVGTFFHMVDVVQLSMRERNMPNKWVDCWDDEKCLNDTAFFRNYSLVTSHSYFNYHLHQYKDQDGNLLIYVFKEILMSGYIVFFSFKGFPLMTRINVIVNRFIEAGLLLKWQKDTTNLREYSKIQQHGGNIVISLSHLQGAFVILLIGLCFAIAVFGLEIILFSLKTRNQKKIFRNITHE